MMHQRRSLRPAYSLRSYALVMLAVALMLLIARPALAGDCSPLCAIYTSVWDPLYWFHGCNNCPPPPPEG